MIKTPRILSLLTLLLAAPGLAQDPVPSPPSLDAPQRKTGTILKGEVDGMVRGIRAQLQDDGSVGGQVTDTARLLTAMGYCHRRYHAGDGPVVRPQLDFIFGQRRSDGSFGTAEESVVEATAWTRAALAAMDPKGYASDIQLLTAWLKDKGIKEDPFEARVDSILEGARTGTWPEIVAKLEMDAPPGQQPPHPIDLLVTLVACQEANRRLDQGGDTPAASWSDTQQKGVDFLMQQQEGGVFAVPTPAGTFPDPGITSLCLAAIATKPQARRSEAEQKALMAGWAWLLDQQNPDGSFGRQTINYTTCAAVQALKRWDDPKAKQALALAQRYILGIQNIEGRGYSKDDRDYGSIGYGGDERGDLSNTVFALDALRASGLKGDHEAMAKAIVFLQRTQNLRQFNDFKGQSRAGDGSPIEVVPGNDGGSAYYPGNSFAGYIDLPDGSKMPRSYGSMTYALLKSYALAGLPKEDPRVKAAVSWLGKNYTLTENPGFDPDLGNKARYQGLFYYYMTMAQALAAAGVEQLEVTDTETGETRTADWRKDLRQQLGVIQAGDGSWVNSRNGRWFESMGMLCTAYVMLALEQC